MTGTTYPPSIREFIKEQFDTSMTYDEIARATRKKFNLGRMTRQNIAGMINRMRASGEITRPYRSTGGRALKHGGRRITKAPITLPTIGRT